MVRGKKGFERVLWAAKNVFDHSLTWLFYDLRGNNDGQGPIATFAPTIRVVEPTLAGLQDARVPNFPRSLAEDDSEEAAELLEWLSLTMMGSARVQDGDRIDPFLCRYHAPVFDSADASTETTNLTTVRWHGFLPSAFATKVLLVAMKASQDKWFAISGETFDGRAYTALKHEGSVMTWRNAD